jgi:hypothetical protein
MYIHVHVYFIYTFEYYISVSFIDAVGSLDQGCTNPGHQVAVATNFLTLVPDIFGSSIKNLLHVTFVAPIILRRFMDFGKFMYPWLRHTLIL